MNNAFIKLTAAIAALSVGAAVFSGCSGFQVPSGLTAAASTTSSQTETTAESTTAAPTKTSGAATSETEKKTEATFTSETVNEKKKALVVYGRKYGKD